MSIINMINLISGLLVFVPSILYLMVYAIFSIVVEVKKQKSLEIVPTEVEGVRERRYHVSSKLLKRYDNIKGYKMVAKMGLMFGSGLLSIALMNMIVLWIKSM